MRRLRREGWQSDCCVVCTVEFFNDIKAGAGAFGPDVGNMALRKALRLHDFTRGLTEDQIASLAPAAGEIAFEENEIVLEEGQLSRALYLVMEGSVTVELHAPRYVLALQAVEAGGAFGWSALLDRQDTMFRVRAREHTRALRLDGDALKALCRQDPALGVELLHRTLALVAGRVKATEIRFAEMCGVRV